MDRHIGVARDDLVQHTVPLGAKVRHYDEANPRVGRHRLEQRMQCADAPSQGTDADNGKRVRDIQRLSL